jgi:hypothetical protein
MGSYSDVAPRGNTVIEAMGEDADQRGRGKPPRAAVHKSARTAVSVQHGHDTSALWCRAAGRAEEAALMDADEVRRAVKEFDSVFATDDVQVNHMVLAPGQEVPWHFHTEVRDTFYVVRGPVTIYTRVPDETRALQTLRQ